MVGPVFSVSPSFSFLTGTAEKPDARLEVPFVIDRCRSLLFGFKVREVGDAQRASDYVEVELGIAPPWFLQHVHQIRTQRASLEAGQPFLPPDARYVDFRLGLVETIECPGVPFGQDFLKLLNRAEFDPGNGLLIQFQQLGDIQISFPREENQFNDLKVLKGISIAQFVNQPPQDFSQQLALQSRRFGQRRRTARRFDIRGAGLIPPILRPLRLRCYRESPLAKHVVQLVTQNREQIRFQRPCGIEAPQRLQEPHERVLHDIFRVRKAGSTGTGESQQSPGVPVDQKAPRRLVALPYSLDEKVIRAPGLRHVDSPDPPGKPSVACLWMRPPGTADIISRRIPCVTSTIVHPYPFNAVQGTPRSSPPRILVDTPTPAGSYDRIVAEPDRDRLNLSCVLLVGSEAFDRLGPILRRLVVGLIEKAVLLRVVSDDSRVEELQLGPVQVLRHPPIDGLFRHRRLRQLVDLLSPPPSIVHAVSAEVFRAAAELTAALESELVFQVSSVKELQALADLPGSQNAWFLPMSRPLETRLVETFRPAGDRVRLVKPGVHAAVVDRSPDDSAPAALFCTGAFTPWGGVEQLIEAFSILRRRGRTVMLFLAGDGPREAQLRRMVRLHDLSPWVTFAQPAGDLTPALQSADVFVEPSIEGSILFDSLEAMAAGVAVVAFPPVASDHLLPDETAVISRSATPEALADALERAIFEPGLRGKIARAGLEYVRANHTVTGMAQAVAEAYSAATQSHVTFSIGEV